MKKILPILAITGTGLFLTGCTHSMSELKTDIKANINAFKQEIENYSIAQDLQYINTSLNKYKLTFDIPNLDNTDIINTPSTLEEPIILDNEQEELVDKIEAQPIELNTNQTDDFINTTEDSENETLVNDNIAKNKISNEQLFTLYSLSNDIEDSCEEFCELKEDLIEAIVETQNLIDKIQNKELELNQEQRMFIADQSMQLKNLSKQLSFATSELSMNLTNLNSMLISNNNIDDISMKYLLVLDNLINRNEMLFNGLSSLNMITQLFKMQENTLPPNNTGRVLYGFQLNNEPPILKDYYIDQNGALVENNNIENNTINSDTVTTSSDDDYKSTIDTFNNRKLESNIDTFGNFKHKNIDTFFNTALLDNEFMYGNGGYGGAYPYLAQQNYNHIQNNKHTSNSDNIINNTQHTETDVNKKKEKRFKISKNIDTYREFDTPSLETKFKSIKESVSGFFGKFRKPNQNAQFPVFRESLDDSNKN